MLKQAENPPLSYPAKVAEAPPSKRWWVAHTRSRQEKALANVLREWEESYFLPMIEKVEVRRQRKIRCLHPLFPGYIFFAGDEHDRQRVLKTNRVAQILYVEDQDQLVQDMIQLHMVLGKGAPLRTHPFLKKGMRCRITSGVFKGVEGVVQYCKQGAQLVLQVEALGQAVAMEIDAGMVEPVT